MSAIVRQEPAVSRLTTSAWLERGRDGIDLPLAAVVAEAVTATAGRVIPWVEIDGEESLGVGDTGSAGGAVVHVVRPLWSRSSATGAPWPPSPPPGGSTPGWANLDPVARGGRQASADATEPPTGAAPQRPKRLRSPRAPGWCGFRGRFGGSETLPADVGGLTPETPILVVLTGGATLDARNRGDLYGVIVVDDGSVLLDGTTLHGAVFATGTVNLGDTGRLLYSRSILRWATDRSLESGPARPGNAVGRHGIGGGRYTHHHGKGRQESRPSRCRVEDPAPEAAPRVPGMRGHLRAGGVAVALSAVRLRLRLRLRGQRDHVLRLSAQGVRPGARSGGLLCRGHAE